jgi:hypothetical protein
VWLISAAITFAAYGTVSGHRWIRYYKLSRHGVWTRGTVVETNPQFHWTRYTFTVNGHIVEGKDLRSGEVPGQGVDVNFLPDDPRLSCIGSPKEKFQTEAQATIFFTLLTPSLATIMFFWFRAIAPQKASNCG